MLSVLMKGTGALQQQTATMIDIVFNFHTSANSFHYYIITIAGYMMRQYSYVTDVAVLPRVVNIGGIKSVVVCLLCNAILLSYPQRIY